MWEIKFVFNHSPYLASVSLGELKRGLRGRLEKWNVFNSLTVSKWCSDSRSIYLSNLEIDVT